MTSSFTDDLVDVSSKLSNNTARLNNILRDLDITNMFSNQIVKNLKTINKKQLEKLAEVYLSFVSKNNGKNVINLYIMSLHNALDSIVGTKGSREIVQYINELLEHVKDEVLETENYKKLVKTYNQKNIKANSVQFLVQKCDLVPACEYMPLDNVLKKIGINKITGSTVDAKLKNASKVISSASKKYGFIFIKKISKNPFHHSIDPLVSTKYIHIHGLMDLAISGINEKTIKRTNTITALNTSSETNSSTIDSITVVNEIFTNKSENFYYIIQTLDNNNYEILIPWGFEKSRLDVPEDFINPHDPVSKRIEKYNVILDNELIKNLKEPMVPAMGSRIEMKLEDSYWKGVVGRIKNMIMPIYKEQLTKLSGNSITITRLSNMINNTDMTEAIIEKISDVAKDDMIKKIGKLPNDIVIKRQFDNEIQMSFLVEMDKIIRKLPGRMGDIWKEEVEPKIIKRLGRSFTLNPTNINNLMEPIGNVLRDTLKIYINRKTGVFIAIRNKLELLSKTLLVV